MLHVYVLKCQFDNVYGLIFSRNEMKVAVNGFSPSNLPDSTTSIAFYKECFSYKYFCNFAITLLLAFFYKLLLHPALLGVF